jgi:hypothetical protein
VSGRLGLSEKIDVSRGIFKVLLKAFLAPEKPVTGFAMRMFRNGGVHEERILAAEAFSTLVTVEGLWGPCFLNHACFIWYRP